MTAFWALLALVVGVVIGWAQAHRMVAAECERLGSFFVGEKVYRCVAVESKRKGN